MWGEILRDDTQRYYYEMTARYLSYGGSTLAWHMPLWSPFATTVEEALLRPNRLLLTERRPRPGAVVLDAGCGMGGLLLFLAERVDARLLGLSNNVLHLRLAERIARARNLRSAPGFVCGDLSQLPLGAESLDIVVNHEAFCHVADAGAYASTISRILRAGGSWLVLDGFRARPERGGELEPWMRALTLGWRIEPLRTSRTLIGIAERAGLACVRCADYTEELRPAAGQMVRTAETLRGSSALGLTSTERLHHEACGAWGERVLRGDLRYELVHLAKPPFDGDGPAPCWGTTFTRKCRQ
jgi:SAM-dependent methyltransferase